MSDRKYTIRKRGRRKNPRMRSYAKRLYRKNRSEKKYIMPADTQVISRYPIQNLVTTLKYVQHISINPGAGTLATYRFRANGAFDPDQTGTGGQFAYYDQLAVLYNHVTVLGSTITLEAFNSDATVAQWLGCNLDDDLGAIGTIEQFREQKYNKDIVLGPATSGKSVRTLHNGYSMKKHLGIRDPSNSEVKTAVTAVPNEEMFYYIWGGALDQASNPSPIEIEVTLTYHCLFTELSTIARS